MEGFKSRGDSLLNPKWVVIHGEEGTLYRLSIFKFGGADHEFLRDTGFGDGGRDYIGAILWHPKPKFFYDNPDGYPPHALREAGVASEYTCPVLATGWHTILTRFDEIPDGSTIRVKLDFGASAGKNPEQALRELIRTAKVEIKEGFER
ncbi:hypothetical protein ES703_00081 [subsurface metagenome]